MRLNFSTQHFTRQSHTGKKNNIFRNDFVEVLMQARNDLVLTKNLPSHDETDLLKLKECKTKKQ